jgi:phage protein D
VTDVTYTLLVDNQPVSSELLTAVQRVEAEEHAELASMVRLRLAVAVNESGSGWTVVDDETFQRLTNVTLRINVGSGPPDLVIDAYVIEANVEFSNEPGQSVLNVVAMDATVLMNLEEKVRAWPNMADSDIATVLFGEHGLTPQIEGTQPSREASDVLTIQRSTDIAFLRRLARRNGYECYTETDPLTGITEGHFHPPRLQDVSQTTLTVNMAEATNVNRFTVRYDMMEPTTAQIADVDVADQSDQQAQIESVSLVDLGSRSLLGGDRPRRTLLGRDGLSQTGELQTWAQAVVDRAAWAITAEGELNTVAYSGILRARRPVNVRGVGRQLSGTYYVEKVLHAIDRDGYTQHFTLRRNAQGLTGNEDFAL